MVYFIMTVTSPGTQARICCEDGTTVLPDSKLCDGSPDCPITGMSVGGEEEEECRTIHPDGGERRGDAPPLPTWCKPNPDISFQAVIPQGGETRVKVVLANCSNLPDEMRPFPIPGGGTGHTVRGIGYPVQSYNPLPTLNIRDRYPDAYVLVTVTTPHRTTTSWSSYGGRNRPHPVFNDVIWIDVGEEEADKGCPETKIIFTVVDWDPLYCYHRLARLEAELDEVSFPDDGPISWQMQAAPKPYLCEYQFSDSVI